MTADTPSGPASPIRSLAVIGAGSMGHGIAQTAALAGIETTLFDIEQAFVDRGLVGIEKGLERLVARDRLSPADRAATRARLRGSTDLQDAAPVDGVIEAVPERLQLKQSIFEQLDAICAGAVFLASNTSSISLQEIARPTRRPERVLGLHYFNPPQILPLVEIVTPLSVDPDVVDTAEAFCRATGKTPIRVKDTPAFVVNRLFVPSCWTPSACSNPVPPARKRSIAAANWASAISSAPSPPRTSPASMSCSTSRTPCAPKPATRAGTPPPSSVASSRPATWVARPAAASSITATPDPPQPGRAKG